MRLIAVGVAVLGLTTSSLAAACSDPTVEVTTRYAEPWINKPTLSELNAKYRKSGERTWLGSTASRLQAEVRFRPAFIIPGIETCTPAHMHIELSFAEHEVNLASEIAGLPCVNTAVTNHEAQHAALNRRMLLQARPTVTKYVSDRLKVLLKTTTPRDQNRVVIAFVENEMKRGIEQEWKRLGKQHAALDTEAEYNKLGAACPSEIMVLERLVASSASSE